MRILWSPERVGEGRRFRIIVEASRSPTCECSDALALLDRTPEEPARAEHRFYFRAARPDPAAEVIFRAGGERTAVRVAVIAEEDWTAPRMQGEIALPRIWPLDGSEVGLKERHTIVPPEHIGAADRAPECPALDWSDEELWTLEPPCDIPRWHFLNLDFGCPVHGLEIYRSDPYYPWIVDVRGAPYRVQCPVGGEWYPTNDYLAGDCTGGEFPDDGFGYERDGAKFGFISYYLLRRIRFVYSTVKNLADYFFATGDGRAARKIAILLVSLAREHRYLCAFPEHRFRRYECTVQEPNYRADLKEAPYGPRETKRVADLAGSGMDDYCINMPYHYVETARAYDLIFDRIDGDDELIAFLRGKMPSLADGQAIRRYIETFLFRAGAQAALDGATSSNLPKPQQGLLAIIRLLDLPECRELTEWLLYGGGQVARMPTNFYYKDGAGYESTGGYNGIHVSALVPLVEDLKALRRMRPELYPADRFNPIEGHERYRHILRWPLEIVVAQLSHPFIGDTGDPPHARPLVPTPIMDLPHPIETYESAVESFPDDPYLRAALEMLRRKEELIRQALAHGEKGTEGFYGKPPQPEMAPDPRLFWPSRLLDGYGVGILESGEGAGRRGVWLYYGDHPGHAHEQPMDMGLFAHGRNLLRHMGYPYSWQFMGVWDAAWITHYTVKVVGDEAPWWRSTARLFHGHGPFQIVEAAGYGISRERPDEGCRLLEGHRLRRTLCLVDLPDGRFYAVDLFRAEGGKEHWWTFHGPPGKMTLQADAPLKEQERGTVAGEDVAYGQTPPEPIPHSLSYLYDVRRGVLGASWSATWELEDAEGLRLRLTQLWPEGGELIAARGRSPHAPEKNPPYELNWFLRHRVGAEPLSSEFISIIEVHTALPVDHAEAIYGEGVSGARLRIGELTHWVLRSDAPDVPRDVDGDVRFAGRAAFVEADEQGLRQMTLLGEGMLLWRGKGIRRGAPDWEGIIVELDAANGRIIVGAKEEPPRLLVGGYLMVHRPFDGVPDRDAFAYRVERVARVADGRWECLLNWSPLIGDGTVGESTEKGFRTREPMPLGTARAYYRGAYLCAHDRRARLRLSDVRGNWQAQDAQIVVAPADRASLTEHFPKGSRFTIEEIGVGDRVVAHGWTELVRQDDGSWNTASSGPAEFALGANA